eukprot:TRINITY_DN33947_c0_g1_i3.p1 TRINITY_DN33947_c0_g1~~TRINITY_DN33947_c0_g1_i3.p1  ORF type:complete len:442 (-),score=70.33 TRINITY_DN33947_c0_g1_i3:13-1254(-)
MTPAPMGTSVARRRDLHPKPLFDEPSLREFMIGHGVKPIHMGRIWKHVLSNPDCSLDEIPGIPDRIREPLKAEFAIVTSTLLEKHVSEIDGTMKLLVRLQDGGEVEAVVIHHAGEAEHPDQLQADRCGQRDTLCISSQVGCRLGCTFCATGTMGLQGNLWAGEIQEQLMHARSIKGPSAITNVVFMGMGEPLENFEAVVSAVQGLADPFRFGLAPSSITVSTVGSSPKNMRRILEELPKTKLAFSLHAPNQALREKLVPAAKVLDLNGLMEIVDEHSQRTTGEGKRKGMVMMSYVLLKGVNDSIAHAEELSQLLAGRSVIVNLIPYNPFEGNVHAYETPSAEAVDDFLKVLAKNDLRVFERRHHGRDISAACGQLAKLKAQPANADIENAHDFNQLSKDNFWEEMKTGSMDKD